MYFVLINLSPVWRTVQTTPISYHWRHHAQKSMCFQKQMNSETATWLGRHQVLNCFENWNSNTLKLEIGSVIPLNTYFMWMHYTIKIVLDMHNLTIYDHNSTIPHIVFQFLIDFSVMRLRYRRLHGYITILIFELRSIIFKLLQFFFTFSCHLCNQFILRMPHCIILSLSNTPYKFQTRHEMMHLSKIHIYVLFLLT